MKKLLFGLLICLSFSAFSQSTPSQWKIQYVWDGLQTTNISSKKGEITIAIADKKISGSVGCNKFNGNLEYLKGNQIKPIKLTNTKENCPATADKAEEAVMKALKTSNNLVITFDKAKFYNGSKLLLELNR